ncbi:MAG: efflux RND transporter periplasmic adaptor subunit [Candidatus Hydrogenedentes bacterium]|nr:efflux RND transporter periplasmic adaptor subunit [Candidatus Hydrogenedentota bacterium]
MSQPVLSNGSRLQRLWRARWAKVLAGVAVAVLIYVFMGGQKQETSTGTLFAAKRGNLTINVLEGGSVEARESQTIKSEIKGETKILSIVDEGYLVTPEDVAQKKVLVTLDNSELIEKITQETIQFEGARADFAESSAQFEITIKQNESDIKKSELDAKFALMDFQKYLGGEIAEQILKQRGISDDINAVSDQIRKEVEESAIIPENETTEEPAAPAPLDDQNGQDARPAERGEQREGTGGRRRREGGGERGAARTQTSKLESAASTVDTSEDTTLGGDISEEAAQPVTEMATVSISSVITPEQKPEIDFSKFAKPEALGDGAAQQQLRKLNSDRLLAEGDLGLAETKLVGTRKLAERNFVTKQELDNDEMDVKKGTVSRDSALTSEELFVKYEFPKEAERLLSAYEEAIRAMERTMKQAVAKQAQAEARKRSSEASYALRTERHKELKDQLDACTLVAERPGLVVYAGSDEPWRNREQIAEGATVDERQEIITIPDMTQMAVRVKIHESNIKRIQVGHKARIKLDSYPDEELTGEVIKMSVIPDSSSRWMNPDMKLYPATVAINGTHGWLKPGMSAEVEILVQELDDVVYVPIQAVHPKSGHRVAYVGDAFGGQEERTVETGEFNSEFIEIKSGLEEGDRVMLRAPDRKPGDDEKTDETKPDEGAQQPPGDSSPQQAA